MRLFACFPFAAVVLSLAAVVVVVEARSQVTPPPLQNGVYRNLENAGIAVRLYHEIAKVEKQANVFFSPVGLSGGLLMLVVVANCWLLFVVFVVRGRCRSSFLRFSI